MYFLSILILLLKYPKEIKSLEYVPNYAIRGLHVSLIIHKKVIAFDDFIFFLIG